MSNVMTPRENARLGMSMSIAPRPHVDSLDGLRAIAVIAVMLFHARLPGWRVGWVGVDLFFVLSGFLITTLLVREQQRDGRISLIKFWGRRFLRLMPAYWLYVAVMSCLLLSGAGRWDNAGGWSRGKYVASLWGYFANYGRLDMWQYQDLSGPLWSLSVEEQFYFIWPILCALALRWRWPWVVGWVMLGAVLISRHYAASHAILHTRIYTRGVGIVAGCAVALALGRTRPKWVAWAVASPVVRFAGVAICAAAVLAGEYFASGHMTGARVQRMFVLAVAVIFPPVLAMLWYGPRDVIARGLSWGPLAYVGRISYGIYLYHAVVKFAIWDRFGRWTALESVMLRQGVRAVLYFGLTIGIATFSYRVIERPFLRLKDRLR